MIRQRNEQALSYSKQVKKMYWPKVSVKKQVELEQAKLSLQRNLRKSAHE